ncbi:MAG: hypothetical protein RIR92_1227, partial [Pseudomonadota bacterium]
AVLCAEIFELFRRIMTTVPAGLSIESVALLTSLHKCYDALIPA